MLYRLILAAMLVCVPPLVSPQPAAEASSEAKAEPRTKVQPEGGSEPGSMRFEWVREGPAETCGTNCREWIAATGPITADTAADFETFSEARDPRGATLVLDSGGGSVLASLALGRKVRQFGMRTSVGRTTILKGTPPGELQRARLSPRGECASMCVFVLLGGVQRTVPAEARILVHQIWPGSKRHDASAESYTAEEIVRVQRDVGRIARYTVEMGGDIELFELAMRIPPWERLRALTPAELRRLRLLTIEAAGEPPTSGAVEVEPPRRESPTSRLPHRGWTTLDEGTDGRLVRRHILTIEGEEIGQFELTLACGAPGKEFRIDYADARAVPSGGPSKLVDVSLWLAGERLPLDIRASEVPEGGRELRSSATAEVAPQLVERLSRQPNAVVIVGTRTADDVRTHIRLGGSGLAKVYPRFAADCSR